MLGSHEAKDAHSNMPFVFNLQAEPPQPQPLGAFLRTAWHSALQLFKQLRPLLSNNFQPTVTSGLLTGLTPIRFHCFVACKANKQLSGLKTLLLSQQFQLFSSKNADKRV